VLLVVLSTAAVFRFFGSNGDNDDEDDDDDDENFRNGFNVNNDGDECSQLLLPL
jgi:hypothetical protein